MTAYWGTQTSLFRYTRDFISRPNDASDWRHESGHPGVCHFIVGDGSVHGLSVTTPDSILLRLVDNNNYDGQAVSNSVASSPSPHPPNVILTDH